MTMLRSELEIDLAELKHVVEAVSGILQKVSTCMNKLQKRVHLEDQVLLRNTYKLKESFRVLAASTEDMMNFDCDEGDFKVVCLAFPLSCYFFASYFVRVVS